MPNLSERVEVSKINTDGLVVQWVVPTIAYTPETYIVEYGTSNDSLVPSGDSVTSGEKIETVEQIYTLEVKGLKPGTKYYYSVVARSSAGSTRTAPSFVYTKETGEDFINHADFVNGNSLCVCVFVCLCVYSSRESTICDSLKSERHRTRHQLGRG